MRIKFAQMKYFHGLNSFRLKPKRYKILSQKIKISTSILIKCEKWNDPFERNRNWNFVTWLWIKYFIKIEIASSFFTSAENPQYNNTFQRELAQLLLACDLSIEYLKSENRWNQRNVITCHANQLLHVQQDFQLFQIDFKFARTEWWLCDSSELVMKSPAAVSHYSWKIKRGSHCFSIHWRTTVSLIT